MPSDMGKPSHTQHTMLADNWELESDNITEMPVHHRAYIPPFHPMTQDKLNLGHIRIKNNCKNYTTPGYTQTLSKRWRENTRVNSFYTD